MTDKDEKNVQDEQQEGDSSEVDDGENQSKDEEVPKKWTFCPYCGSKLPDIERLRFCTSCGLDLEYLREHKTYPPDFNPNIQSDSVPANPYKIPNAATKSYSPVYQQQSYPQYFSYGSSVNKLKDEEISSTDKKLWGTAASLLVPILGFIIMNGLIVGLLIVLVFFVPNLDALMGLISNPLFFILTSLVEFILIIFPVLYVKKYLERPTIDNRFELLGFTTKRFDTAGIVREVLIGLGFAVVGIFIVAFSSLFAELALEGIFGVEIINSDAPADDVDYLISSADILSIILLVLIMLLVVGPSEEIMFRGFMQKGLVRSIGEKPGILVTALIFAAIHLVTLFFIALADPFTFIILFILMFIPYFAISIMLGLMFKWRDENLIAVIVTHGVYNSITVILSYLLVLS